MKKFFALSLFIFLYNINTINAQTSEHTFYYIQLGLLRYPDTVQFMPLKDLGKLYEEKDTQNDLTRILIGKYKQRSDANEKVATIRQRGFQGVFVVQRTEIAPANGLESDLLHNVKLFSVQIGAYKDKNLIPNTQAIEKYGKIIQSKEGNFYKLRLGLFEKEDDARAVLNRVKSRGFTQAGLYVLHSPPSSPKEGFIPKSEALLLQTPSYYKRMQGKMNGNQLVVVHLYYTENSFSGYYTDPNTSERKRFTYYGVNLNDKTTNKQKDVYITRFGGDSFGLSFGIKDKDTGKETVFNLTEQYTRGAAHFDVVTLYRTKVKKVTQGEIGADVFVEYPVMVDYTDKKVQQKFNALSLQFSETASDGSLNTKIESQLLSDLNKINNYFPKYNWLSETYENRIVENSNYLLSIRYYIESIISTPKVAIRHKSFNLKTGQQLLLADVLTANYLTELKKAVDTKLKAKTVKYKFTPTENTTALNSMVQNYYFTSYGIVFFFDNKDNKKLPYPVEVAVTYKDIKSLVKADFLKELGVK